MMITAAAATTTCLRSRIYLYHTGHDLAYNSVTHISIFLEAVLPLIYLPAVVEQIADYAKIVKHLIGDCTALYSY